MLVKKIGLLLFLTVVPVMVINFIVDPLQCFRKPSWYEPLFDTNQRMQNPCLARSYEYDTIIVGTSNVENIDPRYADQRLGVDTLKLAMAGSTLHEQRQIAELALQTGKTDRLIWGIETALLGDDPSRVRDDVTRFPWHLYRADMLGDSLYLLDPYLTKHYAKMLANRVAGFNEQHTDVETLNMWEHLFEFSEERTLAFYELVKGKNVKVMDTNTVILDTHDNIDQNVLATVDAYPDAQFDIFFPPYSILRFVHLATEDPEAYEIELRLKKYLIHALASRENVTVHDFQDVEDITHELNNYKDLTHYNAAINARVIDAIAYKTHVVEDAQSIGRLHAQVEQYDISLIEAKNNL